MAFLDVERRTLEEIIPKLDGELVEIPLLELEKPGGPAIELFRKQGGAGMLVPNALGGRGASPLQATRVHRAVATRSPSLAVAMMMHNFSVATLVENSLYGAEGNELLRGIVDSRLLMASGFAEGRTGAGILDASMRADPVPGGYRINGTKKPCSLSRSMDIFSAGVVVPGANGDRRRAIAIVPASAEGLNRRPFWRSWVLAGAESDEVSLENVFIPSELLFFPNCEAGLDRVEIGGFCWFELLCAATYLGVASRLAELALMAGKGSDADRALLGIELEGGMAAVEGVARAMGEEKRDENALARALFARFAAQLAVERAAGHAAELLGGMAFVGSSDVAYLLAASRALAFHPPSRISASRTLAAYLIGGALELG